MPAIATAACSGLGRASHSAAASKARPADCVQGSAQSPLASPIIRTQSPPPQSARPGAQVPARWAPARPDCLTHPLRHLGPAAPRRGPPQSSPTGGAATDARRAPAQASRRDGCRPCPAARRPLAPAYRGGAKHGKPRARSGCAADLGLPQSARPRGTAIGRPAPEPAVPGVGQSPGRPAKGSACTSAPRRLPGSPPAQAGRRRKLVLAALQTARRRLGAPGLHRQDATAQGTCSSP